MLMNLSAGTELFSPELTRTSFWTFTLLMTLLNPPPADVLAELDLSEINISAADINLLPKITPASPLSTRIVEMSMDKIVAVLTKMPGEKKSVLKNISSIFIITYNLRLICFRVCLEAINLMSSITEQYADSIAQNKHFYQLLSSLSVGK